MIVTKDWKRDAVVGLIYGALFILGNMVLPGVITIGQPRVALLAVGSALFVVGVLAPFHEEIAFRGLLNKIVDTLNKNQLIGNVMVSVAFALFHWRVYGLALASAFIGAFLFSMITLHLYDSRKSLVPCIVMHSMVNVFIFLNSSGMVSVGA